MPAMKSKKPVVQMVPCYHCRTPQLPGDLVKSPLGRFYCEECNKRRIDSSGLAVTRLTPKVKKVKVKSGCCATCDKRFPMSELTKCEETYQLFCEEHVPGRRKKEKSVSDTFGWFVLACEPGSEGKVKNNLLRKLRIESAAHLLKRCIIARQFEDRIVPIRGTMVCEDTGYKDQRTAAAFAKTRCSAVEAETGEDHRYSVFPDKAVEKGKESNTWGFKITTIPTEKELRTIGVKRYPGYLICKVDATPEFGRILKKVPSQWGLLLDKIHQNFTVTVSDSIRAGGWVFKVKGDGKTLLAKGGPFDNRDAAITAGKDAKAKCMEIKPVPLKTEEAAREMLNQKVFSQLTQDKETRTKAQINFRRGSEVEVIHGEFEGQKTKVTGIDRDRDDKSHVTVWVDVLVMGQPVPYSLPYWQLRLIAY